MTQLLWYRVHLLSTHGLHLPTSGRMSHQADRVPALRVIKEQELLVHGKPQVQQASYCARMPLAYSGSMDGAGQ